MNVNLKLILNRVRVTRTFFHATYSRHSLSLSLSLANFSVYCCEVSSVLPPTKWSRPRFIVTPANEFTNVNQWRFPDAELSTALLVLSTVSSLVLFRFPLLIPANVQYWQRYLVKIALLSGQQFSNTRVSRWSVGWPSPVRALCCPSTRS